MAFIGRYEILSEIGRGAMGAVYKARDPKMDRVVALKVILTTNLSAAEFEKFKQRFYREAQAAGKMSHPGIITIHDIAEDATGHPFQVMEFIEGETLESRVEQTLAAGERLPLKQSLDIGIQVAQALDYAHRRGVVHRDIKPANIMLTAEGVAKIADFGIAKITGTQLTQTGSVLGTPAFMSPEQFRGDDLDARTDLFSLGAVLYWMLTGDQPFPGESLTTVSFKVVFGDHVPARQLNPALPEALDVVLARCLAKAPADRFATCRDLAEDLEAVRAGKPIRATPVPPREKQTVVAPPGAVWVGAGDASATLPLKGAPMQRTVAAPAAQATVFQPAAAAPRRRSRKWIYIGAFAALLIVAAVLRPKPAEKSPPAGNSQETSQPAQPPPSVSPPDKAPERSAEPDPVSTEPAVRPEPAASKPASKKGQGWRKRQPVVPVAMSTLRIECQHNFETATFEVYADDQLLFRTLLKGTVQGVGALRIAQGTLRRSVPIPAGQRVLRVHVESKRDRYNEEDLIGGTFPEGASKTLLIDFGRGSGLRVFSRKLTLRWQEKPE